MKKGFMALALLMLLALSCALAEEEVFYVLEYDGNGGHCGISPQVIYPGETITLSNSTASRSGHYFLGWATTPDSETAEYQPKDSFTADHDTTLYAVWMECPDIGVVSQSQIFTFTYPVQKRYATIDFQVARDGYYIIRSTGDFYKGLSATTKIEYGSYNSFYYQQAGNDFEFIVELKAGVDYQLMYYQNQPTLNLEFVCDGFSILTFDGNGTSASISPVVITPGKAVQLPDKTVSWSKHYFLGWATTPDAETAEYQPKDSFTAAQDATLYAVWADCPDLGVVSQSQIFTFTYPVQKRYATIDFRVAKDGYYQIRSTGDFYKGLSATTRIEYGSYNSFYYQDADDDFEFVVELKAGVDYRLMYYHNQPTLNLEFICGGMYIVKYDGNGTSCSIPAQVKTEGVDLTLATNTASRTGYFFLGWATTPDAAAAQYQPGDTFSIDGDTNLYAVWMPIHDLGIISGRRVENITYPVTKRFASFTFTAGYSGYYHIYTTDGFYKGLSASTNLEYGYYDRIYAQYANDDFFFVAKLEEGVTYTLNYYQNKETLPIVFQPQYKGKNYVSDIQLTSAVRGIGDSAFEGTALTHVAIPASMPEVNPRTFADCTKLESVLFYGMDTRIAPDAFAGCKDLVIIAPVGSTAQAFAEQMGWDFLELK